MTNKELVEKIKTLNYYPKIFTILLKRHHAELYNELYARTAFLDEKASGFERLYCLAENITERQICPVCKKKFLGFNYAANSYRLACSSSCLNKLDSHKQHVTLALDRCKVLSIQKRKITCLQKYGGNAPACSKAVQQKMANTRKALYNDENYNNREKYKKTCIKKYNVDCIFKLPNVRSATVKGIQKTSYFNNVSNSYFNTIPLFSFDEYCNRSSDTEQLKFKCAICNHEYLTAHYDGKHNRCPKCYPEDWSTAVKSKQELQLLQFVKTACTMTVLNSNRTVLNGKELDIYIPEKQLAIEYDGLYWHSDILGTNKTYHLDKSLLCEKQGILLIHVFENEWLTKQDIVKSRIKNLLGLYDKTIFARKCEVKEVNNKISKQFQENNHILGAISSAINLGMFYNNELISLMTFGKCRFDKKHEWELLRFCNKLGYHIPGAAGKLLKHFERNYSPKSLVSYADRRWSRGKVYEALGFKLNHVSPPNYWYFNSNTQLESRIKYQKHKLKNILKKYDSTKTEIKNMADNGYLRIFDCGNLVFEKTYL